MNQPPLGIKFPIESIALGIRIDVDETYARHNFNISDKIRIWVINLIFGKFFQIKVRKN